MKIELVKTKESDGNWYKIRVDGLTKACVSIHEEEKDLKRATEIYDFLVETKGSFQVIKETEIN
jgi:hypothetical protein